MIRHVDVSCEEFERMNNLPERRIDLFREVQELGEGNSEGVSASADVS